MKKLRTLVAVLVVGTGSARAAAPTVAINSHIPTPAESSMIAQAGVSAVRMDFNWFNFEPARGVFSWGYLDQTVAAARANGLQIFPSIGYTPKWAASLPTCDNASTDSRFHCLNKTPVNVADWTNAVSAVVNRYKGQVLCWGIWNEPNLKGFFDGSEDDFVTKIFLPAAAAIRAADPTAKICGPELAGLGLSSDWNGHNGTCLFGNCIRNGWEIDLAHMLDRLGPQIDIITQHAYKGSADATMQMLLDGETTAGVLVHDSVRHVIDTHGGAGKEFWLTETGWAHTPGSYTEAEVATRIVDLYAKQEEVCAGTYAASTNDNWPVWTRTFYFHFQSDPNGDYGIVKPNGMPRLAYGALKTWATARTTSACGMPGTRPDAGSPDAGQPDAGARDAGSSARDAGVPDSGVAPPDAGSIDPVDAGGGPATGGGSGGGSAATGGGAGGSGGGAGSGDGGTEVPIPMADAQGGCGCGPSSTTPLGWLALIGLGLLLRPRRRAGARH